MCARDDIFLILKIRSVHMCIVPDEENKEYSELLRFLDKNDEGNWRLDENQSTTAFFLLKLTFVFALN